MFGSLFKPVEVKGTLHAIEVIRGRANNPAFSLIESDIRSLVINQADKTVASIKDDGLTFETLVYLLMTNVLDRKLLSGQFHTYRGVLNMQGSLMLNLWDYAVDQLLVHQLYDASKADHEKRYIRTHIAKAG